MKIVYNIAGTYNSGGMERVLSNKANFLVKLGHQIQIVTTDQKDRKPYFELDSRISQVDLGINYFETKEKSPLQKIISYALKQRMHRKRLTDCLTQLDADVVISMFDHEASFLYKIRDRSKKILEIHFSRYKRLQYERTGLLGWIDRFRSKMDLAIVKKYDRFVVLTQEDKAYWGDLTNIKVIPNANSFESEKVSELTNNRVIAVGRFDDQKGFDQLIKVWGIVHKKEPNWILSIYGDGPKKVELERLIGELGLQNSVQLCPPTNDIEKAYLESSIFVLTSRYEGLPMVLLEAQVCGLPMVSFACKCGPRDIIENGINGYLVEPNDLSVFAKHLIELMSNVDLRKEMGKKSRLNSNNFDESVIMKQWMELITNLVNKPV